MKPSNGKWRLVPDSGSPTSDMDFTDPMASATYDDFDYDPIEDWYVSQNSGVRIAFLEKDPPEPGPPHKLDFVARWEDDAGVVKKFMGTATKV